MEPGQGGRTGSPDVAADHGCVQGTLHEHIGHALAEQAAHLHTTVDGALDVHAGSEDTVLLAGHMGDLWDGGAAIVAALRDAMRGGEAGTHGEVTSVSRVSKPDDWAAIELMLRLLDAPGRSA